MSRGNHEEEASLLVISGGKGLYADACQLLGQLSQLPDWVLYPIGFLAVILVFAFLIWTALPEEEK